MSENAGDVTGFVLAGGGSTRFGRDKALVELEGRPMLVRMRELLGSFLRNVTVIAAPGKYAGVGVESTADRWPGEGPLGGIITALTVSAQRRDAKEWNLIVGCDLPFLTRDWLVYMTERALTSSAHVMVPKSASGWEPLCACWRTSARQKLEEAFDCGVRKVTEAMKGLEMEVLDEPHWKRFDSAGRLFWNMNTLEDYQEAQRVLQSERP